MKWQSASHSGSRNASRRGRTYLSPDAGLVVERRNTEGFERGQDDENGRPSVVERERQVDEQLVGDGAGRVMLLDDVVNVSDGGANQEREDEGCVIGEARNGGMKVTGRNVRQFGVMRK